MNGAFCVSVSLNGAKSFYSIISFAILYLFSYFGMFELLFFWYKTMMNYNRY